MWWLIDIDAIWRDDLILEHGALQGDGVDCGEPAACPLTPDDLTSESLGVDAVFDRLKAARVTSHA